MDAPSSQLSSPVSFTLVCMVSKCFLLVSFKIVSLQFGYNIPSFLFKTFFSYSAFSELPGSVFFSGEILAIDTI